MTDERDLHETKPLADDVPVRLDARRLDAQWSRISARLEDKPRLRWPTFAIVPALVVAVVLVLLVGRWRGTPTRSESALTLGDGSTVAFGAGTALALREMSPTRMALELTAGRVLCDVTHVEGRTFVVRAGGHDVTVLGTRFTVSLGDEGHTLEVRVERGRVRVSGPSGEHVLTAGQSFSTNVAPVASFAVAAPPVATASPSIAPSSPPVDVVASAPPSATTEPRLPPAESPKELFAKAMEARSKGQSHEAASALDSLRKRHRSDARAGLAAFELGRLRLDTLNEPAGAAEAFADAMALSPNGPFREDAEARRVEALERAHDGRCAKAKAAYLERFPTGLHVKTVSARCGN